MARQCELKIDHFAHYPLGKGERRACQQEETAWHLAWKFAFLDLAGWEIEVPLMDGAYRADAYNAEKRKVREFVHSLSPHYVAKHRALLASDYDVGWLVDGKGLGSARLEEFRCRNGTMAIRHILKPRAMDLVRELGSKVAVHWGEGVWKPGRDDRYWFKVEGHEGTDKLLGLFGLHITKPVESTTPT